LESSDKGNNNLKIAFFSVLPPFRGGISSFSQSLLEELQDIAEVQAYTFKKLYPKLLFPGKSQEDSSLKASYPRIVSTMNPFSYFKARKMMRKGKPDAFIVSYWMTFFAPMFYIFSKGFQNSVLKIAIVHNLNPHEKRFFDRFFNRIFLKNYDAFVVLSKSVQKDLLLQKPDAPYILLKHPQYKQFGNSMDKTEARGILEIPASSKVLLFFGLIRDYKGLDVLIESMNHLDDSYFLLIAGEIYGDKSLYQNRIDDCSNSNILLRDEYIPDHEVAHYFSSADLCVLPYKKGTQSGVQAISDSFCTPVLVSKNGGLHESVKEGSNGFVIDKLTPVDLAKKIADIFSKGELERVGEHLSLEVAKNRDEWKNFASHMNNFILAEKAKKQ